MYSTRPLPLPVSSHLVGSTPSLPEEAGTSSDKHVSDERDDMECREGFGISLIVFDQPPTTRRPGKAPLDMR
jgi:hypothetical protein